MLTVIAYASDGHAVAPCGSGLGLLHQQVVPADSSSAGFLNFGKAGAQHITLSAADKEQHCGTFAHWVWAYRMQAPTWQ